MSLHLPHCIMQRVIYSGLERMVHNKYFKVVMFHISSCPRHPLPISYLNFWFYSFTSYVCVYMNTMCMQVPSDARRGHLITSNYMCLWAIGWVLGTRTKSSTRAADTLTCRTISPAPISFLLLEAKEAWLRRELETIVKDCFKRLLVLWAIQACPETFV